MYKLNSQILRSDIKQFGNHFLVLKLEQLSFPEKLLSVENFRTEIQTDTEFPTFIKTNFDFEGISLGNRLTFKVGLYSTKRGDNFTGSDKELIQTSKLIGSGSFPFTVDLISKFHLHNHIDITIKLYHPERDNEETGNVSLRLMLIPIDKEAKIYVTNKEIESCYYDPFEKDKIVIREKLLDAIALNEEKQYELESSFKALDQINQDLKKGALDLNKVRMELNKLDKENELLARRLHKLQNIDEIHIEIDLLSQSVQGIEIIKNRYAVLCAQLALQTEMTMNLECDYKDISQIMTKISLVKEKIESLKESNKEVNFNIKREEDLMPLLQSYIYKTKTNDSIIKNLKNSIDELVNLNKGNLEETEKRINSLYIERKLIEEKKQQMALHQEVFSGNDKEWEENFVRIIGHDLMMNNMYNERERYWINQYKKRKSELEETVKDLSEKVVAIQRENENHFKHTIVVDPGLRKRKVDLVHRIDLAERREKTLINEIETAVMFYKSTVAKLKDKIEEAEKFIDKEVEHAKKDYYKTNQYGKY